MNSSIKPAVVATQFSNKRGDVAIWPYALVVWPYALAARPCAPLEARISKLLKLPMFPSQTSLWLDSWKNRKQLKHSELSQKDTPAAADSDMGFMGGGGLRKKKDQEKEGRRRWRGIGEGKGEGGRGKTNQWTRRTVACCFEAFWGFEVVCPLLDSLGLFMCIKTGRSCPNTYPSTLTLVWLEMVWIHQWKKMCACCCDGGAVIQPSRSREMEREWDGTDHGPLKSHHLGWTPVVSSLPCPRGFFARTSGGQRTCDS